MSFNLQKYLIENNLTLISSRRLAEEEAEQETSEPAKEDMKGTEKDMRDLDKNKKTLADLQAKVKDVIFKHTIDTPTGKRLKNILAYKKAVGNLPQQIKDLKKKIDAVETPSTDNEENQD